MNVQVMRIATKFREMFSDEIDMTDVETTSEKYENSFNSRCLAAYALVMQCGIDNEIAAKCVTDGYHDCGIDAVFKDENSKILYVVQAKWSNDGNGTISQGDSLKYVAGIEKILNMDFNDFNDKVKKKQLEIESAVTAMDYQIKMIIIYTSNNECPNETINGIDSIKQRINDECNELLLSDIVKLSDVYDSLANATINQDIVLDDVIINDWGVIQEGTAERGYYGMISASDIAIWWKDYGNKLLAKNIRFFKGDTEVNNGIVKCLKENPEKFCYYNNGIKILANKITRKLAHSTDRKNGLFRLEGVSIVNGAQTTGSIGRAYVGNPEEVEKAKLMVQVISLEDSAEDFGNTITKLSNTQNKIENKAFASMDLLQEKLRKDLMMDGIEYIFKDGDTSSGDKICNIDEAVVAIGCYKSDVSLVALIKRAVGSIFEDISKQPYKSIFNPSTNAYMLWNTIKVSRTFDRINADYQKKNNGIKKMISVNGLRLLLNMFIE
ncbi:MAG: AIPR family protein [Lachnospiraceae bacterium]|nr:AIPR family protein [Lachnospiraceae bacterium]